MRWQFRGLIAAALGAALALAWFGIFVRWPWLAIDVTKLERNDDVVGVDMGAAMLSTLLTGVPVLIVSVVLGWLVLDAARVRPAWPSAVLGPVLGGLIAVLALPVLLRLFEDPRVQVALPVALGYGIVAIASTPRKA